MRTIEIRKLTARYRLPRSAEDERRRLDQALRAAMTDGTFEEALALAGVSTEGELCIQNIYAPARLRLSGTDGQLAFEWSKALARTIKRAIYGGQVSGVAHYSSRVQALVDMAIGVSLGDMGRAWAWRQLGLWRARPTVSDTGRVSDQEALSELVAALAQEPALIAHTLRTLSLEERLLERLAARLSPEQWTAIASAALARVNSSLHVGHIEAQTVMTSPDVSHQAQRLASASRLFEALAARAPVSAHVAHAMAILMILEVNPAALGAGAETAQALTGAVAHLVASARNTSSGALDESQRLSTATTPTGLNEATADRDRDEGRALEQAGLEAKEQTSAGELARGLQPDQELEAEHLHETVEQDYRSAEREERPLPVVRQYAFTRFGGLLFLLGVIEDLGLPQLMLTDAALAARSIRWIMQRLALALVPAVEPSDPAVMAFAGLAPDAPSPAEAAETATELEEDAIKAFAEIILENLRARLEPLDELERDVIRFVCGRRAELVADPGWIEAHLSLDDVSTKIRGAGLDLNPGYVPWLGVVVKFIYE